MRALLLALLALLLAGCSGGGSVGTSTSDARSQPTATVEGVIAVGRPLPGMMPRLERLDGTSAGQAPATDAGGGFLFPGGDYPADFRILVDVPGFGTLAREVRGYTGGRVRMGVVGHLVAAELAAHPQAGLAVAESRMKAYLGLPSGLPLDGAPWLGERGSAFSDDLFLRQAAAAGGVDAFVALLLQDLDGGGTRSFAEEPLAEKTDWETFLEKVNGDLAADVPDLFGDFAIGWAAGLMGLNTGKEAALQEVAQDLDVLGDQIDSLSLTLTEGFADSAFDQAAQEIELTTLAPVETRSDRLAANALRYRITDEPFTPDPEVTSLTSLIASFDSRTALENLTNALLGESGGSNMLALGIGVLQSRVGIVHSGPLATQSGIWSNALVVEPLEALAEFYSSYATLALNLLVEAGTSGPRPGVAIASARLRLIQLSAALKAAALQVPPPMPGSPSDAFLVDYENGRMWYLRIQYPVKFADVTNYFLLPPGKSFQAAPYDDWQPAHEPSGGTNDLETLYARLKAANPANPAQALATLGFTPDWDTTAEQPDQPTLFGYVNTTSSGVVQSDKQNAIDMQTGQQTGWPSSGNQALQTLFVRPFPNTALSGNASYLRDRDPDAARATGVLTALGTPVATAAGVTVQGTWTVSSALASLDVPNLDATSRVVWTSSDPTVCVVSNGTGTEGQLTWYRLADGTMPGPVTITASTTATVDAAGNVTPAGLQKSVTVNPPGSLPDRTLTSLLLTPRNRTYLFPDQTEQYYATAYWSDGLVTDVTAQTVWTVAQADGSPLPDPSKAFFESGNRGMLALKPGLHVSDLQLTGTFGGLTRSVKAKVVVDFGG